MCKPEGMFRQKRHRWNPETLRCKRCGKTRNPAAKPLPKRHQRFGE